MKLTVFSWNIGNNSDKITKMIDQKKDKLGDILVFGFQEAIVSKIENDGYFNILRTHLSDYVPIGFFQEKEAKKIYIYSTCKTAASKWSDFGICTLVFKKRNIDHIISITKYNKNCPKGKLKGTKGYVGITLLINNDYVDIINTHMPFTPNQIKYENFSNNLEQWLKANEFNSNHRILFGDLNSRSLLTKDCLSKDIGLCSKKIFDKNYCAVSDYLENLNFNTTIQNYNSPKSNNTFCVLKNNCSIKDDISSLNDSKIINLLKKNDFLGNPPKCGNMKEYTEKNITFLPTYKRDKKSGKFSLKKEKHGRLPGYADRIIYKTSNSFLNPTDYNLIGLPGNDHLPIYKVFELKSGGYKGGARKNRNSRLRKKTRSRNNKSSKKRMGFKFKSKKLKF